VSSQLRQALSAVADPAQLVVVSRDEMARVYEARGAGCHPDDTGCIVDASGAWGARLFVRGTVSYGADGFVVSAGIDSVSGLHVADASVTAESYLDVPQALPQLARSLVERERAFRAAMPKAPAACPRRRRRRRRVSQRCAGTCGSWASASPAAASS
jgi:hypothetical protein